MEDELSPKEFFDRCKSLLRKGEESDLLKHLKSLHTDEDPEQEINLELEGQKKLEKKHGKKNKSNV